MRLRPPRVATWVLRHLGSGQAVDAVAGDLCEEWKRGRSRAWYWRQVLVAVTVGFGTEISSHKLLAVRAVGTGWFVAESLRFIWTRELAAPYWNFVRYFFFGTWWGFTAFFVLLVLVPIHAFAGWAVSRYHQPYGASMVLLYVATWWAWNLPWIYRQVQNALGDPRYIGGLRMNLVVSLVTTGSILLGGLWRSSSMRAVSDREKTVRGFD